MPIDTTNGTNCNPRCRHNRRKILSFEKLLVKETCDQQDHQHRIHNQAVNVRQQRGGYFGISFQREFDHQVSRKDHHQFYQKDDKSHFQVFLLPEKGHDDEKTREVI